MPHVMLGSTAGDSILIPDRPDWTKANPFTEPGPGYEAILINAPPEAEVMGFLLVGEVAKRFYEVTCPCGVTDTYALNSFPEVDTPHSCGNPKHWFVKYMENDEH